MNARCVIVILVLGLVSSVSTAWIVAGIERLSIDDQVWLGWTKRTKGCLNRWDIQEQSGIGKGAWIRGAWGTSDDTSAIAVPAWSKANEAARRTFAPRVLVEMAFGWPFRCLRAEADEPVDTFLAPEEYTTGGVPIEPHTFELFCSPLPGRPPTSYVDDPGFAAHVHVLPLRPIWIGLAINTLVHAGMWFILLCGLRLLFTARRLIRWRQDRCLVCGYSRHGSSSAACPECGSARRSGPPGLIEYVVPAAVIVQLGFLLGTIGLVWSLLGNSRGPSDLHLAARWNDVDRIDHLLETGADVNSKVNGSQWWGAWNSTPLDWAVAHDNLEAIDRLLASGARVEASTVKIASVRGHLEALKRLIAAGLPKPNSSLELQGALATAVADDRFEILEVLLGAGARVETWSMECPPAVVAAAEAANSRSLRAVLASGVQIDPKDGDHWDVTALGAAARTGRIENMNLLANAGAEINPSGAKPPLYAAMCAGQSDAAMWLLEHGARVDRTVGPLLCEAADHNLVDVARYLIAKGADLEHEHGAGWWPLRRAAQHLNLELMRLFIDAGANRHRLDDEGRTILFEIDWAAAPREFVEYVFSLGIDIDHRDRAGATALMQQVCWRNVEAVRILLEYGADADLRDLEGRAIYDLATQALDWDDTGVRYAGAPPDPEIVSMIEAALNATRKSAPMVPTDR